MKIDPICGMQVDEAMPLSAQKGGETFYFCSDHCRRKFLNGPAENTAASPHAGSCCSAKESLPSHRHEHHSHEGHSHHRGGAPKGDYYCPMCPGVSSDKPGDCPKCGMPLEKAVSAPNSAKKVIYTCPMHPEVEQDHAGDCPKCGMPLEPKEINVEAEEDSSELRDMSRRCWVGLILSVPVLVLAMAHLIPGVHLEHYVTPRSNVWVQFALSTPVVFVGGLAVSGSRLEIGEDVELEHVHSHCPGSWNGVCL